LLHFSADYVAALKERVLDVARRRQIRIMWDVAGAEDHDHRVRGTPRKPRKQAYDHWDWRMKNRHPGFCRCVYDRLRINADGFVAPCAYSIDGELELGNLADTPFDEMWNGERMQDLRRAHHTWDYPAICATCRFKDPVGPRDELPFMWDIYACLGLPRRQIEPSIELIGPDHMTRTREAPELCFGRPPDVEHLFVVLALGGESDEMEAWRVGSGAVSFRVPEDAWERMRANVGWWWTVIGFSAAEPWTVHTGSQTRCLIRHRPLPRIPGSGLVYPDAGHAPVDLGGVRMPVPA
jgi:radical SAM protein with 4Fe4S-binding SPASM domain